MHARCEFTRHVLLVGEEKLYLLLQSTSKNWMMDGGTYDAICMYKQTGEYPMDLQEMVDKAVAKQKKRLFRKRCDLFVLNEGALFICQQERSQEQQERSRRPVI